MINKSKIDLARIVWNITNKCNFNCSFCYTNSSPDKQYGLDTKSILKIVSDINQTDVSVLSLIGGEPLLRKDICEIINAIDDRIYLKLDTNGSLLLKNWSNSLERLNSFSIGLEGEKATNELDRKSTESVLKSINFLLEKNKIVNVPILVNKNNFKTIKESLKFILRLGVNRVQVNKFLPVIGLDNKYLSLTTEDENFVLSSIVDLLEEMPEIKDKIALNGWKNPIYFKKIKVQDEYLPSCHCGELSAAISFDGYFVPCTVLSTELTVPKLRQKYSVPNLNTDTITNAYINSKLFQDFRSYTNFLSKKCLECSFNNSCTHGCRGYTLLTEIDIFSHDPTCNI